MGAANKISGNKIKGIKVLKKKVIYLGKIRSSLRHFNEMDFSSLHLQSYWIYQRVFLISSLMFSIVVNMLFPCIFHCKRTFCEDFLIWNYTETRKKVQKIKSLNGLFISRTFFHRTFLVPNEIYLYWRSLSLSPTGVYWIRGTESNSWFRSIILWK